MSYRPTTNWGCISSATLFGFVGVPLLGLMTLGERECDIVKSHPCAISWGWMQLIHLAVVVAVCLGIGWLVNLGFRRDDADH